MDRFFYFKYLGPNLYFDNKVNQRMKKLNGKVDKFDDLLELFQILLYVDKVKKFEQQKNYKSDLNVDKGDLYPLINEYNNNYAVEDICRWLEQVAKKKQKNFFRSECGFWSFLYEYKKNITLIIEKYFNLCISGGIFLDKNILKKYFNKISDLMIQNPKSIEFYYYNFNGIQEFSNKLCDSGKKKKIIANYLELSDLNITVLNCIMTDSHISTYTGVNARLINISKEKYNEIINSYLKKGWGIKKETVLNIGDKPLQSDNPLETIFNLDAGYMESNLNGYGILKILLKNIPLIDYNYILSVPANRDDGLMATINEQPYPGKSFPNSHYENLDYLVYDLFRDYVVALRNYGIHMFDFFNDFFGKIIPERYYIYNFIGIIFEKGQTPKGDIREMMEKLDIIFKFFDGFTEYEGISMKEVDQIKHVPRINDIKSLIPKKYVYVTDDNIIELSHDIKNNSSVLEKLKNNNCFASVLEDYEYTLIENLFNKQILCIENGTVMVENPGIYAILTQLSKYGYIIYHGLNRNQQDIVDGWINGGKAYVYNRLFSKIEADYLNYYLNDTFVNGLRLRNEYTHGSTNTFTENQHEDNEMVFIYILTMILLKLNEEFSYFKNNR